MFVVDVVIGFLSCAILVMLALTWALDKGYLTVQKKAPAAPPYHHPCEFSHRYIPVSVQYCNGDAFTLALKFCAGCNTHHVFVLAGKWTIEELLQTGSTAASEIERLEKMAAQ